MIASPQGGGRTRRTVRGVRQVFITGVGWVEENAYKAVMGTLGMIMSGGAIFAAKQITEPGKMSKAEKKADRQRRLEKYFESRKRKAIGHGYEQVEAPVELDEEKIIPQSENFKEDMVKRSRTSKRPRGGRVLSKKRKGKRRYKSRRSMRTKVPRSITNAWTLQQPRKWCKEFGFSVATKNAYAIWHSRANDLSYRSYNELSDIGDAQSRSNIYITTGSSATPAEWHSYMLRNFMMNVKVRNNDANHAAILTYYFVKPRRKISLSLATDADVTATSIPNIGDELPILMLKSGWVNVTNANDWDETLDDVITALPDNVSGRYKWCLSPDMYTPFMSENFVKHFKICGQNSKLVRAGEEMSFTYKCNKPCVINRRLYRDEKDETQLDEHSIFILLKVSGVPAGEGGDGISSNYATGVSYTVNRNVSRDAAQLDFTVRKQMDVVGLSQGNQRPMLVMGGTYTKTVTPAAQKEDQGGG
jgi:hypothetical protein